MMGTVQDAKHCNRGGIAMTTLKETLQVADWEGKKSVSMFECPDTAKADGVFADKAGIKTTVTSALASDGDRQSERSFSDVLAFAMTNALSMVMIIDDHGVVEYANKKFYKVTGYSTNEVIGQPISLLWSGITPERTLMELWLSLRKEEGWTGQFSNRTKMGQIFWELAYISPVRDETGRIQHFLKIATDITGEKRLEVPLQQSLDALRTREAELQAAYLTLEKTVQALDKSRRNLRRLSYHDALTGLLNRRGYQEALPRVWALAERQGHGVGLLMIDIDHFKQINDEHGHGAGDCILKTLSARLRSCLRSADLIYRFGGDEFVVALPDADVASTRLTAQRICDALCGADYRQGKKSIPFTVSIGAACKTPGSSLTPETLQVHADRALRRVKHAGRNGIAIFCRTQYAQATPSETRQLSSPCCEILGMLVAMLGAHNRAMGDHCRRVAQVTAVLAETMALPKDQIACVTQGALLSDIGTIDIPTTILLKPGKLTASDWRIMQRHPKKGYDIVNRHPDFKPIADIILSHHERYDGTGYPRGLKGEKICLGARISAVAAAYDTIRVGCPYASARSAATALAEIQRCRGSQFDPAVVDALERCQPKIEALSGANLKESKVRIQYPEAKTKGL